MEVKEHILAPSKNPRKDLTRLAHAIWFLASGLLVVGVASLAFSVVNLVQILRGNISSITKGLEVTVTFPESVIADPDATQAADAAARLTELQTTADTVTAVITSLLWIGILVAVIRTFLHIARGGSPFTLFVTRRLELVGILAMIDSLFSGFFGAIVAQALAAAGFISREGEWESNISFAGIGVGLILFAVAAAFEYGSQLQRDTDGLI